MQKTSFHRLDPLDRPFCIFSKANWLGLLVLVFIFLMGSESDAEQVGMFSLSRKNALTGETALEFGIRIQERVKMRDLKGLLALTDKTRFSILREEYIKDKQFSDIFSEEWRAAVLAEPPCSVGYRGFMFGNGHLWYNNVNDNNECFITGMNFITYEEFDLVGLSPIWVIDGVALPPQCFSVEWLSSDNYEAYVEKFLLTKSSNPNRSKPSFYDSPGEYFGDEISSFKPIVPSWSDDGEVISLVGYVEEYQLNPVPLIIENGTVKVKADCSGTRQYKILAKIPEVACRKLAPYIQGKFIGSYLLNISGFGGGSMGRSWYYTIYGAFELKNGMRVIIPLKNLRGKNEALDYLDTIKESVKNL